MRDRPTFDLFLVSWLVLFLELACIRWFPSHVMFLTFFTNIVLLASFVGMSVGCLAARNRTRYIERTPTWLLIALLVGLVFELYRQQLTRYIAVGNQAAGDVVFFGTEVSFLRDIDFRVPVEVIGGLFFLLIATVLVGPGQELGRAFNRVPNRTRSYAVNLLGSLAGIGSFAACSYFELPPVVWFAATALGVGYFLSRPRPAADPEPPPGRQPRPAIGWLLLAIIVVLSFWTSGVVNVRKHDSIWSPYYRIDYHPEYQLIETNLVSHQRIEPTNTRSAPIYALPYLFQRDLVRDGKPAWPAFKRVLIIGAGSGNDVARAVMWLDPDAKVDAVEIDPVIQRLGSVNHPDRPYQDPRVNVHLNDGRNFLSRAVAEVELRQREPYDLVIFALVDSLVLHSGYSNLRLESYLFTKESFADVRKVLRPSGVCAVYNVFRHGWLVGRISEALAQTFGAPPLVVTDPNLPDDVVRDEFRPIGYTAFFAGSPEAIDPLREAYRAGANQYWVMVGSPIHLGTECRFGEGQPPSPAGYEEKESPWKALRSATLDQSVRPDRVATDDWPFLYVRQPTIPTLTWRGIGLMVILSGVLWWLFRPRDTAAVAAVPQDFGLVARSFFLGAGFMLVETKAVVHMALLFGSTWMVNTVVFAAVLLMSLAGTLFAGWVKPKGLQPYYVGLFAALAAGLAIPLDAFLGLDRTAQVVGACALVFAPIAFAGVIFATSFRRSTQPDRVFGANVAGALLGGLSENASVLVGFQYLLCVAVGFYLLSAAFGNRTMHTFPAGKGV